MNNDVCAEAPSVRNQTYLLVPVCVLSKDIDVVDFDVIVNVLFQFFNQECCTYTCSQEVFVIGVFRSEVACLSKASFAWAQLVDHRPYLLYLFACF